MLGVVKIDELQLLQAQQAQAALDAAPHLRTSEDASLQIAIGLCGQHESRRDPAKLAEYCSNAALAFAIAVGSSGIQEIKGASPAVALTSKESTNCGQGALFPDAIRESLRHIAEWGGANTDWRHLQACRAKWARGQRSWGSCLRRHMLLLSFHGPIMKFNTRDRSGLSCFASLSISVPKSQTLRFAQGDTI